MTLETGKGSPDCPWRIRVYLGQQINVTLINFARSDPSAMHSGNLTSTSQPRICYRVANIRERQVTKPVTECDDSKRISHVYTSASNLVEIDILSVKAFNVHFLIHYRGKLLLLWLPFLVNFTCTTNRINLWKSQIYAQPIVAFYKPEHVLISFGLFFFALSMHTVP